MFFKKTIAQRVEKANMSQYYFCHLIFHSCPVLMRNIYISSHMDAQHVYEVNMLYTSDL